MFGKLCVKIIQKTTITMRTKSHLSVLINEQARKYGEKTALTYRDFGSLKWKTMSWNVFSQNVKKVSNALLNLGIKVQENVGVFSQNTIYSLFTDFGAFGIRAVTIPFYATSSEQQMQFVITDAQIRLLFVGEQDQYDKAYRVLPLCPTLERIVVFDNSVRINNHDPNTIFFEDFIKLGEGLPRQPEVEKLYSQASYDDIANILYTSGTTGDSKGVVLTYGQYEAAFEANDKCVPVGEKDRVMNFLPYTHIFERGWTFFAMGEGAEFIVNTYPHEIQQSMRETRPTCMCSVPRFWEKVYAGVQAKIDKASPARKALFKRALRVGRKYNIECLARGKRPSLALAAQYTFFNKTLFKLIRQQLGLDKPNIFPTAGATVSQKVEEFVHSIGIDMIVGYGLTESLATVSCNHKGKPFTVGSVGIPVHNISVKIGENNEILLKGPTITRGYYKRDDLNSQVFDADGYFHTGDSGFIRGKELFLTDRIKDLYKTSNGKYIAPQMIEAKMLVDKFIEQIAVIADQRKFVSALIVPDFAILEEYARDNGIKFNTKEDLCKDRRINKMIGERINMLQQGLAGYETIKRFTLLPRHFSMEAGELTNTLKIRRSVLLKNYAEQIDKMYEEE
jgi:long-chain acyl-CoA synthetase